MIELINTTKYYKTQNKNKYILNNVSLKIPSGINVGILGKNGAGKSTLLKMLGGIDFPNFGEIKSDKSFSWVMGLSKGLQSAMTGKQNVKFVCRIYGKNEMQIHSISSYVKEFSELGDYFDMPIKLYSNGMKSRLAFSLSLAFDFDYFIIDEIFSVGDASFQKKSKEALRDKMQNSNILIVSHSNDTLRELCDAGLVINNGKLRYHEHIEDAINDYSTSIKEKKKKILSDDDLAFATVAQVARHYKVNPKSIQQALQKNNGSSPYLKKVFWIEGSKQPEYQEWKNIVSKETILSSDGMIFHSVKEACYFYEEPNIEEVLQQDGYCKKLQLQFYYLSEYK